MLLTNNVLTIQLGPQIIRTTILVMIMAAVEMTNITLRRRPQVISWEAWLRKFAITITMKWHWYTLVLYRVEMIPRVIQVTFGTMVLELLP